MFNRILVARHGTDRALRAFDAAGEIARNQGAMLQMISIQEGDHIKPS